MNIKGARERGEEVASKYNSDGMVPFPFEKIASEVSNLSISESSELPDNISGFISFNSDKEHYFIIVNKNKVSKHKYFTLAHELGHYFLHETNIVEADGGIFIDNDGMFDGAMYRSETMPSTDVEREANNFAGALLMPEAKVREAWKVEDNIQKVADIFGVSSAAMTVRLSILKLVD